MGDIREITMSKLLLNEVWCEGVDWIKLVEVKVEMGVLVNTTVTIRLP